MSETLTHTVDLTEVARDKVRALIEAEANEHLRLRIEVKTGGCSGFIYQLFFDEELSESDAVRDFNGVQVVVDMKSVPYLDGASIDYEDTIQKQGFTIDNPNAQSTCACGDSFG
jgi:iron-sulfur cluster assembly accessory protein